MQNITQRMCMYHSQRKQKLLGGISSLKAETHEIIGERRWIS